MENKTLSIRMVKMKTNTGTKQGGKYFKSYNNKWSMILELKLLRKII